MNNKIFQLHRLLVIPHANSPELVSLSLTFEMAVLSFIGFRQELIQPQFCQSPIRFENSNYNSFSIFPVDSYIGYVSILFISEMKQINRSR